MPSKLSQRFSHIWCSIKNAGKWKKGSAIKMKPRILVFRRLMQYYNSVWAVDWWSNFWHATCGGRAHASFTFVVDHDHSMFWDVARRPDSGEFPTPCISHVEPVGLYEKKGDGKAKEKPSCPWWRVAYLVFINPKFWGFKFEKTLQTLHIPALVYFCTAPRF